MERKPTKKYLQDNVHVDEVSKNKAGHFVFRNGFFYTHGRTKDDLVADVQRSLTELGFKNFRFVDAGEHWRAFKGGASLRTQSHWYAEVEFTDGLESKPWDDCTRLANECHICLAEECVHRLD